MDIPFYRVDIPAERADAVADVLDSGWISPDGDTVARFERMLADRVGADHVIATDSGTAAIHLALAAHGIGPGDDVVVPSYTYGATVAAVAAAGARPVVADVDPRTGSITPDTVERAVTGETAAVVAVHLFGRPADMDGLAAVAERHGAALIEDAAQAFGARYRGGAAGSIGDAGCFSFSWNKPLTTGKGGALVTDDDGVADTARELADYGRDPDGRFARQGYNFRMDSIRAALGVRQLETVDAVLSRKRDRFRQYHESLQDVDGIRTQDPDGRAGCRRSPVFYTVRTDDRDALADALAERGIGTDTFYDPVPAMPAFDTDDGPFPGAAELADTVLGLPSAPNLTASEVDRVVRDVTEAADRLPI